MLEQLTRPVTSDDLRVHWSTLAALPFLALSPFTMCMCGHMSFLSLPFTTLACLFSWFGLARAGRLNIGRAVVWFFTVMSSLMLYKNIVDILWVGHSPLLG